MDLTSPKPTPKRRWLRFSLWTLLLLVGVTSILLAYSIRTNPGNIQYRFSVAPRRCQDAASKS